MAKGVSEQIKCKSLAYCYSGATAQNMQNILPKVEGGTTCTVSQCGTNNLDQELRLSIPAMSKLLDTALANFKTPILVNAIPGCIHKDHRNSLIVSLNTFLKHRCSKSPRLIYVNCNPSLEKQYYNSDGIHFNTAGVQEYCKYLSTNISIASNFTKDQQMTNP